MQQPTGTVSPSASSSFADLLAGLTLPGRDRRDPWDDDDLADDVGALSYERALRTHRRYRGDSDDELPTKRAPEAGAEDKAAAILALLEDSPMIASASMPLSDDSPPVNATGLHPGPDRKCSSITIRMSKSDCEQLRKRAAEAGLTVSAYLRSCTIEAENLRSQVKEALAQLHASSETERPEPRPAQRISWRTGLKRFLPRLRLRQKFVEA